MNSTEQVFKTKWGYVAYSYEDYNKLKSLNIIFQKARIGASRWKRWVRKAPHNRIRRIPQYNDARQKIGYIQGGPLPEPITCPLFSTKLVDINRKPLGRWFMGFIKIDNTVEIEYKKARYPVLSADRVEKPELTSEQIDELLHKAEKWYATI